jgi:hypothetical protein
VFTVYEICVVRGKRTIYSNSEASTHECLECYKSKKFLFLTLQRAIYIGKEGMAWMSFGFFKIRFTITFSKVKVVLPRVNMAESALSCMRCLACLKNSADSLPTCYCFAAVKVTFRTVI